MKKLLFVLLLVSMVSCGQTNTNMSVVEYKNRGLERYDSNNYNGAISDFSKAIELNPNDADPYLGRGLAKDKLKDYYGAISDYSKAIELNPNDAFAYNNRGIAKYLGDLNGACADLKKASSLGYQIPFQLRELGCE